MRILQVIPYFYPAFAFGGPVQAVYTLSKKLVERGHEVVVYTTDARDMNSRINNRIEEIEGAETHYFRNISMMFIKKSKFFVTPCLFSEVKKKLHSFDVVHLHEYRTFQNLVVHYYAMKQRIPYVLQAHGSLPLIMSKQSLKRLFDLSFGHSILRDASITIALSHVEAQQYRNAHIPNEKIVILPNGIDLPEYAHLPPKNSFKRKFKIQDNKKMLLYLGRIHKTKGIDFLIDAYAHLVKVAKKNSTMLVIAGPNDGYLSEAKSLVSSLDISDSVLFTGFISNNDKLCALVDADLFITPSFHGFPITFLEACAVGTPIVTTTLGDVLDWINGNAGFVVQPTKYKIAEAMNSIISDDALREEYSRNCRKLVRSEFSLNKVVDKLEQVYTRVTEVG